MAEVPACSTPGLHTWQKETLGHEADGIGLSGGSHPAESVGCRESRKGAPVGWTEQVVAEMRYALEMQTQA